MQPYFWFQKYSLSRKINSMILPWRVELSRFLKNLILNWNPLFEAVGRSLGCSGGHIVLGVGMKVVGGLVLVWQTWDLCPSWFFRRLWYAVRLGDVGRVRGDEGQEDRSRERGREREESYIGIPWKRPHVHLAATTLVSSQMC